MPKVKPSFAVEYIDRAFPNASQINDVTGTYVGFVRGLEGLISAIDPILLPVDAVDSAELTACRAAMMSQVRIWENTGTGNGNLGRLPGRKESIVAAVRRILAKCPDDRIPPSDKRLTFVKDEEFRRQCLGDLQAIEFQLRHELWKPATVLAGALIEALLCDALREPAKLVAVGISEQHLLTKRLEDMIEWAFKASLIKDETRRHCKLSEEYRNLIHPGKELRKGTQCNKGTAYAVVGGLHLVINDLSVGAPRRA